MLPLVVASSSHPRFARVTTRNAFLDRVVSLRRQTGMIEVERSLKLADETRVLVVNRRPGDCWFSCRFVINTR